MKNKILAILLVVLAIITVKAEAVVLTQKLGSEYIETTVDAGERVSMKFTSKPGFSFKNWTVEEGNLSIDTQNSNISFIMPNRNVVIRGNYDETYTITFNSNGGEGTTANKIIPAGGSGTLTKNAFTKDGYRFTGWSETSNGTVEYTDEETITPTKNITLYAVWEEDSGIDLATIKVGSYIAYQPNKTVSTVLASDSGYDNDQTYNPSSITSWKVFKNTDGQLDIISSESVGSLTLEGATGYAKAVYTLNKMCSDYVNPTYATSGRSLGYKAGSSMETIDTSTYPLTWDYTYNQGNKGFPYTDSYYGDDLTIINTAVDGAYPLRHSSGYVWLASRSLGTRSSGSGFYVRDLGTSGSDSDYYLYISYSGGTARTSINSYGVRPVVSLKSEIQIIGGDGSSTNPYIIQ